MRTKTLLFVSVSASALFGAMPAYSQPAAGEVEAALVGSHDLCDRGDRNACIRFGFILGENRAYWQEWRQLHPEWWAWEAAAVAGAPTGAQVASITDAPPELPDYEQPPIPGPGYLWTPGYWAYGDDGYYWVPGTWVLPPAVGLLWTPGYWGWRDGVYVWNGGYWGPQVGFYGGIDYGFGYGGAGYEGGRWNGGVFVYNRTVNNFGAVRITNVYSETVVVRTDMRVSFNGGNGGIQIRPTAQEEAFSHEQHTAPTAQQTRQQQVASADKSLLVTQNHGHPAIAATAKPGEFKGPGVVAAREAPRGGTPPAGAKLTEPNAPPAKPLPPNSSETKKTPETPPSAAGRSETNPTEFKKPVPAAGEAVKPPSGPSESKLPERKEGPAERSTLNNGAPPKQPTIESKPVGNAAPARPVPQKPPPPQLTTESKPHPPAAPAHPAVAPHPPAKPAAPDKDKKQPG